MPKTGLKRKQIDKFYTSVFIVDKCIQFIKMNLDIQEDDICIEPSAGNGSFIDGIKSLCKNHFFFDVIPFWIIVLMPAFLISGPFLSDLGVSLVAILFLVNSKKNNLGKYYNNYYFIFFFLFWVILVSSSLLSDNKLISLKNSLFYFRFGIFSLCFWYLLDKNVKIIKYLFISFLVCFTSLIVDGYIQYIFGKNLIGYELYSNYRVSSFFGPELILGSYLVDYITQLACVNNDFPFVM